MTRKGGHPKRRITAREYDAILAELHPTVCAVMLRFDIAPTTVGKLAVRAAQMVQVP